jgi:hypothetical protein
MATAPARSTPRQRPARPGLDSPEHAEAERIKAATTAIARK